MTMCTVVNVNPRRNRTVETAIVGTIQVVYTGIHHAQTASCIQRAVGSRLRTRPGAAAVVPN